MPAARVLVVDDDLDLLHLLGVRLGAAGYEVIYASSGEEAVDQFRREHPRVVVTDVRMGDMDGHALFSIIQAEAPTIPVIMLTAHGTIPEAVAATQRGAFSFLTKPFDGQELLARVAQAMALSPALPASVNQSDSTPDGMIATTAGMRELLRHARRLADGDTPVLIVGPSGAGKKVLAAFMHRESQRSGDLLAVRCRDLVCDETPGISLGNQLALARTGTLLLHEIEFLPAEAQTRLLPLVMERDAQAALSGLRKLDQLRIIATTEKPLDSLVQGGRFRPDLSFGLGRSVLTLPSLAQRPEDIPALVAHFMAQLEPDSESTPRHFAPDALKMLCEAPWPGNLRQLRSVVGQALKLAANAIVPAQLVHRLIAEANPLEIGAFDEARRDFEYDYLIQLLRATEGNVTRAARIAARNRTEFYKLLARHEIDPATFKTR